MKKDDIMKAKYLFCIAAGISLFVISIIFSSGGFNIEVPELMWMGIVLGITMTIMQLAFTGGIAEKNLNVFIFAGGLFAYAYSGYTNYVGIMGFSPSLKPAFAIALGEFVDIMAEPLIIYGCLGLYNHGGFAALVSDALGWAKIEQQRQPDKKSDNPVHVAPQAFRQPVPRSGSGFPSGLDATQRARWEQFQNKRRGDGGGQ